MVIERHHNANCGRRAARKWSARTDRALPPLRRLEVCLPVLKVLGLVKLAETRHPWSATDTEIDEILQEFELDG